MSNTSKLLKLNLQFFGDEEFGAYDPSSAYEGIESAPVETGGTTEPAQVEQPAAQEPEYLDFGGRKVAATDELRGLHQDYVNQQRYITQLQQQSNTVQQSQQTQQPQAEQAPSANIQEWDEDTWNKFYENPQEILGSTIQNVVSQILAEKVDPILQERAWEQEIQKMNDAYPDFGNFTEQIQQVLEANPGLAERDGGLEDAYYRAKAMTMQAQPSPDQLAQNPQFIQNLLNNPQVQQQFLNQYLAGKQQINQQTPNLIGRGAAPSFAPAMPENSPTTLREASRLFMKNLGIRN